ncbi:hypothetical protein V3C99_011012 [Haemonchus contortus]
MLLPFQMGMTPFQSLSERLFTWLLTFTRCYAIVFFILPLSFFYNLLLTIRNKFVYTVGTAPRAHSRKVMAIQRQVHEWAKGDRKKKMLPIHDGVWDSLTRLPNKETTPIYTGTLMDILEINRDALTVRVEPMITMGELSRVLIPLGYCLPILPGTKHLTVEDAINGRGSDVSGRKYGLFQHICLSYELIMPDGSLVTASKDRDGGAETQALFYGVPWSEGTLGIMVAATLRMIPIKPYVKITYIPVRSTEEMQSKLTEEAQCRENEFVEGLQFTPTTGVVLRGRFSEGPPKNWGPANQLGRWYKPWFYTHVQKVITSTKQEYTEFVSLRDFYHRHSRSLYWELKDFIPFGNNFLFRWYFGWLCPPNLDLIELLSPRIMSSRLDKNRVRKDFLVPMEHLAEAIDTCDKELEVYPLWLSPYNQPSCPGMIRQRSGRNVLFVNVGVYGLPGKSDVNPKASIRRIEDFVRYVNGVSVVHDGTEMNRSEFWQMFDSSLYEWLRVKYNCKEAFLDVYDKVRSMAQS